MGRAGRLVAVLTVICLALLANPATASAKRTDRVGGFRDGAMKVRIDKAGGKQGWKKVTPRTKVFLVNKKGDRRRVDADQLVRGAKVVGRRIVNGRVRAIAVQEKPQTGAADCSFDSELDDDYVTDEDSFECSNDYDDGELETDTDCSYDSGREGPANDWSMDASWDCSYSEIEDGERDGLDWDCSYSASAGGYSDRDGGDVDADLDFDCSWSGASTDSVLWDCSFIKGSLGFQCVSEQLGQEFGYTIDVDAMTFTGGMDFQTDVVEDDEDEGEGVRCRGNDGSGYGCSVGGEMGRGDCDVDWDFDASREAEDGDVSGSLSYSCSWDR